ncbi:MAG TPA: hypothetical protein VHY37_02220 [Tepidisphaeraceae bacterium]|jgi:hypothetical protein|nr:hypothetical protein [Tepidisphaeraceae bacterium]
MELSLTSMSNAALIGCGFTNACSLVQTAKSGWGIESFRPDAAALALR